MYAENKGWGQALLIGAGVVAIGGGLWYLYTNREVDLPQSCSMFERSASISTQHRSR